jgi:hypothetical protein
LAKRVFLDMDASSESGSLRSARPGRAPVRITREGERFTKLTVISEPWLENSRRWVTCRCDCGAEVVVRINSLLMGNTKSCGCLQKDKVRARNHRHGDAVSGTRSAEHRAWSQMKDRCANPNRPDWKNYGGRGIRVCERWIGSFENFLVDMGRRPGPQYSIDRIANNGHYEPENCRWATKTDQARNNRRNRLLTYNGETLLLTDWARKLGIGVSGLHARLRKMSVEDALSRPISRAGRRKGT